jgi:KpsF/GutQ family protein
MIDEFKRRKHSDLLKAVDIIQSRRGKLVISGLGKSGIIARKFVATLTSVGIPSIFLHAAEASHGDLGIICNGDVLVAISWSGNTIEFRPILNYCSKQEVSVIGITSNDKSYLAQSSACHIFLPKAKEMSPFGLAPTTSTTLQLIVCDVLSTALMHRSNFEPDLFYRAHPGGILGKGALLLDKMVLNSRDLYILSGEGLLKAIDSLTATGMGLVLVINSSGRLKGIITDGDLRRYLKQSQSLDVAVDDILNDNYFYLESNLTVLEAIKRLNELNLRAAPVLNQLEECIGCVNLASLIN